jgi:hypothetical protein
VELLRPFKQDESPNFEEWTVGESKKMFVTFSKGPKKWAYGKSHVFNLKLDMNVDQPETPVPLQVKPEMLKPLPVQQLSVVKVQPQTSSTSVWAFLLPIFIILALIAAAVAAYMHMKKKKNSDENAVLD